ncbi:growth arrest-specific protein 1b [Fundulus heteroclitus]|uniref:growth arrest-specific protein 1b n=1 Tax=Fundulus heteroclitus TaxID=8078 RepID=UPI00165C6C49|nr:growth arrest-specific protein 1b [Fundulus heteroclitus]
MKSVLHQVDKLSCAILMERILLLICCELVIAIGFCGGSPNHNRRPVCWKAILKCHGEPECRYAYDQYLNACASVISGGGRMCPSHCISSLIQLNLTRNGPDLEDCDCATDPVCRSTQQAIDPCVPRTSTMGCTEARLQCETDRACSSAMRDYLFHCRKLFGRQKCSESCRKTIANMRSIPKAQQLDACICDGSERNICEYIKLSMKTLCSDSSDRFVGSGFSDSEEDTEEDDAYQDDYQYVDNSSSFPTYQTQIQTLIFITIFTGLI